MTRLWRFSLIFAALLGICLSENSTSLTNSSSPVIIKKLHGKASNQTLEKDTVHVFYQELTKADVLDLMRVSVEINDPKALSKKDESVLDISVSNGRDNFVMRLPVVYPNVTLYSDGKMLNPLLDNDFGKKKRKTKSRNEAFKQTLVVTVQSRLHEDINYTLHITRYDQGQYLIRFKPGESKSIAEKQHVTFVRPIGYYLNATAQNVESFHITVTSDDDLCANLITLPANESLYDKRIDLDEVDNRRIVTFTRRADVFFSKTEIEMFKEFRIFVIITPDDTSCGMNASRKALLQKKKITFEFVKLQDSSFFWPIFSMILFFAVPALIFGGVLSWKIRKSESSPSTADLISVSHEPSEHLVHFEDSVNRTVETVDVETHHSQVSVVTQEHVDSLSLHGEMLRYPIAIILPILMHTAVEYHKFTTSTMANRDEMCFHNHACAKPFGEFRAWNNMISNIGYAVYGVVFVAITMIRRRRGKISQGIHESTLIDVTIGVVMVLQAIASATYHICPSGVAFQFDTPCIQVICCLLIIRQWLVRLESPSAAYSNILLVAVISQNFLISALAHTSYIRYLISLIHAFIITIMCYTKKSTLQAVNSPNAKQISTYFTAFFSLANLIMMIAYSSSTKIHLNQIVTYCCILNCVLYLIYYAVMKKISQEKIGGVAKLNGVLAVVGWILAAWFFFQDETDWTLSPAASRALNTPCLLFDFFGSHDLWHIFGATAGLFTFLFVSFVDDEIVRMPNDMVHVF